jgi:threonylcarbamoyladenosine tRNA methylthiotransferase MtaB
MSTVAIHTLGCKLNYSESSSLAHRLKEAGFEMGSFQQAADFYIINTCSVTENADRKCRAIVRQALKRNPEARMIIVGCYAQLKPAEIADIPGVDLVLGAAEKFELVKHLQNLDQKTAGTGNYLCGDIDSWKEFIPSESIGTRTRSFLKVQDGCSYNCSFCTIPLARGKSRSDKIENVIQRLQELEKEGIREVVLSGINLGDFGIQSSTGERTESFFDLIQAIEKSTNNIRYRISSIEPNLLHPEIIEFVAESPHFAPHFHIPLQSGSNSILAAMRRRYRRELYADRIARIQKAMPDVCIGADVIVGFPGESEALFQETVDFIQSLNIQYLHVFPYSERDNTLAIDLADSVNQGRRMERSKILQIQSQQMRRGFQQRFIGESAQVLFENKKGDHLYGYSENYLRVKIPYSTEFEGQLCRVQLGDLDADGNLQAQGDIELIHPQIKEPQVRLETIRS